MKTEAIVVGAAALAAGVALGCFLQHPPAPDTPVAAEMPAPTAQKIDDTERKALRQQVKDLRRQIKAEAKTVAEAERAAEFMGEMSVMVTDAGLEIVTDPEQIARMDTEAEAERVFTYAVQDEKHRLDFLSSIDTSKMSAADRETHEQLLGLLAKRYALLAKALSEGLSTEARDQLRADARSFIDEIVDSIKLERGILLRYTAAQLGFSGEEVNNISEAIIKIVHASNPVTYM